MCAKLTETQAAQKLLAAGRVLILSHAAPDGDTVGSAFALCRALQKRGVSARIRCSDELPPKYDYLFPIVETQEFEPSFICAVDIADTHLFGKNLSGYTDKVDLCIDHHISNTGYAKDLLLRTEAAATCEIIAGLMPFLGVETDKEIANAAYTGLASDTGCFRYSNTTPATLRCAALMAEKGADTAAINKRLFETVSMARLKVEAAALQTLRFYHGGRTAIMAVPYDVIQSAGAADWELEGIASLPSRVAGVLAGVTLKEKRPGYYKISMRTGGAVDASAICSALGGGGHRNAAGCELTGSLDEVREKMAALVGEALGA